MKKLNLGCGQFKKSGYINVDWDKSASPDVVHNLSKIPYPFKNDYFNIIEADHVLEHLDTVFVIMKELHRILKPNGKLIIKVPHFSRGFTHAEHKTGFDVTFPYYFNPSFKGGYTGIHYKLEKIRMNWQAQFYLKKEILPKVVCLVLQGVNFIVNIFANISPLFCSRFWCFLVGGFEEIIIELKCIKKKV